MAYQSSHIFADAHNQLILQLHREWARRVEVVDPDDCEAMDEIKELTDAMLEHPGNTGKAVCAQLVALQYWFTGPETFDLEAFGEALQTIFAGAWCVVRGRWSGEWGPPRLRPHLPGRPRAALDHGFPHHRPLRRSHCRSGSAVDGA